MGGRSKRNLALYLQEEDLMRPRYENTGTLGGHSSTEATGGARLRQAPAAVLIRLESLQTHRLVLTGPDEMKLTLESLRTGGHQKRYLDRRRPRRRQRLNIVNVVIVGQRSRTTVCAATRSRGLADRQTAWCPDGWYLAIMVRCLCLQVPPTTQRSCTRREDGCAAYARVSCA